MKITFYRWDTLIVGRRADGRYRLCVWPGGVTIPLAQGRSLLFRPPWNRPLFSERYGHVRFLFRCLGFRLFVRGDIG